jgi:metal-responsive CopG/Arc/MetJ family transcriptional regulator
MQAVRVNVSLPRETFEDLSREIEPRKRSRFVAEAIQSLLKTRRAEKLAAEYREAAREIKWVNADLEGVVSDGLD